MFLNDTILLLLQDLVQNNPKSPVKLIFLITFKAQLSLDLSPLYYILPLCLTATVNHLYY